MASGKHAPGGTCILKGTGLKGCAPRPRGALRRETTRGSSPGGTLANQDDLKGDASQGGGGGGHHQGGFECRKEAPWRTRTGERDSHLGSSKALKNEDPQLGAGLTRDLPGSAVATVNADSYPPQPQQGCRHAEDSNPLGSRSALTSRWPSLRAGPAHSRCAPCPQHRPRPHSTCLPGVLEKALFWPD